MKKNEKTNEKTVSDIPQDTEDDKLNIKYQDKEYNESYKKWRRENKDSLGFYFVEKPGHLAYQDGVGFINDYPETQEEKAMRRAINILGWILVFRTAFDIFSTYILPLMLERLGADIRYDFYVKKLYGDETFILNLKFILNVLSMVLPVGFLMGHLHMPFKVMMPVKIHSKPMFAASIPIMLLICGVCSAMSMLYEHILSALRIDTTRTIFFPDSVSGMIYMAATDIIIIPVISELCTRGVILQFTRQFGDGTALLITGIITAALTNDITKFCFVFIAAIALGYFTIRTGSVLTAIVMRITFQLYSYILYYIDYKLDSDMAVMIFILAAIITGFICTVIFLYRHSDCFGMKISVRYLTYDKKLLEFFTSTPIIIWLTLCFIITLLNIKFIL